MVGLVTIFMSNGVYVACHSIDNSVAHFTDRSSHNEGVAFAKRASSATIRVELAPGVFGTFSFRRLAWTRFRREATSVASRSPATPTTVGPIQHRCCASRRQLDLICMTAA